MKTIMKLIGLLTALCLLAGCASGATRTDRPQGTEAAPAGTGASTQAGTVPELTEAAPDQSEATAEALDPAAPEPVDTAAEVTEPEGEPEGWEEEWPPEYPLAGYRLLEGAIRQTGRLNQYRYTQLDGAERYMDLAADYVREALACGDELTMKEDSPHDGYANWFMEAPTGSASVSGSSITGRFCFSLYPGFDRVLEMTEAEIADRAAMEQAAWAFTQRFFSITGDLELVGAQDEEQHYHDERSAGLKDVTVPAVVYTFTTATGGRPLLELQEGLQGPVLCGDSTLDDLSLPSFTVTVWPDGTVVRGNNYVTRAQTVPDGDLRMLDEGDVPELITYLTSTAENDTVVIESIRADRCSVYFGYGTVEPLLTMTYYFESDPADRRSTEFVLGLIGEE